MARAYPPSQTELVENVFGRNLMECAEQMLFWLGIMTYINAPR
jgi:hypothetical protein